MRTPLTVIRGEAEVTLRARHGTTDDYRATLARIVETAAQLNKLVEREVAFVWALLAAAGALFVLAAMPNLALAAVMAVWLGAFCGLAWVSGYTLLQAIFGRDYPVIQAMTLLIAFTFIFANLLVDVIYGVLDPRIRVA